MKKQRQNNFTLIEILTVIVIIMILSGILYPVLGTVRERGKISETQTIVVGVKTAIDTFKMDNGYLPYPGSSEDDRDINGWSGNNIDAMDTDSTYGKFFDILTYSDYKSTSGAASQTAKEYNPKAQRYLDAPKKYFSTNDKENSVRDSWGRPLYIMLDLNQDGLVEVSAQYSPSDTRETFLTSALVVSMGSQETSKLSNLDNKAFITSNK